MINVQALDDNKFKCDKKIANNDDVSPCTENCALKNQINHENHFVRKVRFQC